MKKSDEKVAMRVSFVTIVSNFLLSVIKFVAGIISNSSAMISDAMHPGSPVSSALHRQGTSDRATPAAHQDTLNDVLPCSDPAQGAVYLPNFHGISEG